MDEVRQRKAVEGSEREISCVVAPLMTDTAEANLRTKWWHPRIQMRSRAVRDSGTREKVPDTKGVNIFTCQIESMYH